MASLSCCHEESDLPMIRSIVALFVFAVALCAYIVMQPDKGGRQANAERAAVTRAQTDSILGPIPDAIAPTNAALIQAPVRNTAPGLALETEHTQMERTAANVLAGLGLNVEPNPNADRVDPMQEMTASVLSGIGAITGNRVKAGFEAPEAKSALELLVVKALQEGQDDAYINTIVNAAAKAGEISVPDILVTSDGDVDTAVLLSSIISQAQIAAGGPAPAVPNVTTGEGVEVRVVQRATQAEQYRFYTVNQGDSLGAIAVKFYGSVDKFSLIYEANRQILSSPNAIKVGQRLAIPSL